MWIAGNGGTHKLTRAQLNKWLSKTTVRKCADLLIDSATDGLEVPLGNLLALRFKRQLAVAVVVLFSASGIRSNDVWLGSHC